MFAIVRVTSDTFVNWIETRTKINVLSCTRTRTKIVNSISNLNWTKTIINATKLTSNRNKNWLVNNEWWLFVEVQMSEDDLDLWSRPIHLIIEDNMFSFIHGKEPLSHSWNKVYIIQLVGPYPTVTHQIISMYSLEALTYLEVSFILHLFYLWSSVVVHIS